MKNLAAKKPKRPLVGDDFKCVWVLAEPIKVAELSFAAIDRSSPESRNKRQATEMYSLVPGAQPYEPHPWGMLIEKNVKDPKIRKTFSRTSNTRMAHLGLFHPLKDHGHKCRFISKDGVIQTSQTWHCFELNQDDFLGLAVKCANEETVETQKILDHLKRVFPQKHVSIMGATGA